MNGEAFRSSHFLSGKSTRNKSSVADRRVKYGAKSRADENGCYGNAQAIAPTAPVNQSVSGAREKGRERQREGKKERVNERERGKERGREKKRDGAQLSVGRTG